MTREFVFHEFSLLLILHSNNSNVKTVIHGVFESSRFNNECTHDVHINTTLVPFPTLPPTGRSFIVTFLKRKEFQTG